MPYIILDRDGVINFESSEYIKSPEEWRAIPGSLEAIARLNKAGFQVLIATNQSGVARGHYTLEMLSDIHEKLIRELAEVGGYIEEIFFCPHHPDAQCPCRKPRDGMLANIKEKYPKINFNKTYFIGDSIVDMQVALTTGCQPVLVLTGNGLKTLAHPEYAHIPHHPNLSHAVEFILSQTNDAHE